MRTQGPMLRSDIVLFIGGLLMGVCLTAAVAVGWASAALAERAEARR